MLDSQRYSIPFKTLLTVLAASLCLAAPVARAQDDYGQQPGFDPSAQTAMDPPSRVGRLSIISGSVGVEPASVNEFSAADLNSPLTTGDRVYADAGSLTEIQTSQQALRVGQLTDVTLTALTDSLTQFGLAQGSVHLRTWGLDAGTTVELDTPNVAVTVLQPGDIRVDVDAANDTTQVTVLAGQVQVNGNGLEIVMQPGESLLLSGNDPVGAQNVRSRRPDALDRFSTDRDSLWAQVSAEAQYLNPETIGAEDLVGYGTWDNDPDYGAVWYPSGVAVDWQPYRNGHWTWIAPWGWTWVEYEPWGFAPFHYGRWSRRGDRWGWIPGPVFVRPVYSPALVVFLGGGGFQAGVTAWFPLGPGEVYTPWYHASPLYVNRVNVSNIYSRNQAQVRNIYNQRTTNVYVNVNVNNRGYANRDVATVAMQQSNFAAGRRADQSNVRVDQRQLGGAQVLPHPLVTPERTMITGTPTRAVPPMVARPTLASHEDTAVHVGTPMPTHGTVMTNQPAQITRPTQQTPQPSQQQPTQQRPGGSYRQPIGQQTEPSGQQTQTPATSYRQPIQQQTQTSNPQPTAPQTETPRPATSYRQPIQQQTQTSTPQPTASQTETPRPATSYRQPIQQQTQPAVSQQQVPAASQTVRPLFNKAVPPDPRPSFDQQREAIQATDPGRPLSPLQLNNIRQNQPVGQPQQREVPHPQPSPAPRPEPAPARSNPSPANRH
jgi:hypothetical protein